MALSLHQNPKFLFHSLTHSLTLSMDALASPVSALFLPSNNRETLHLLKPPPSSSFPNLSAPKPNPPFSLSVSSKPLSLTSFSSTPSPPPTTLTGRTHHRASTGYAAALFDFSKRGGAVALAAIARDVHRLATSIASIIADSSIADEERAEAVRATVDCGGFDRRLVALVRMVVAKKSGVREVADVLEEFGRLWRETASVAVEEADLVVVSEKKMGIEQLAKVAGEVQRACGVVQVKIKHIFRRKSPRPNIDFPRAGPHDESPYHVSKQTDPPHHGGDRTPDLRGLTVTPPPTGQERDTIQ